MAIPSSTSPMIAYLDRIPLLEPYRAKQQEAIAKIKEYILNRDNISQWVYWLALL